MLGLAKYSLDYAKGPGLLQCWYPDISTVAEENNVGRHNYIIMKSNPKASFSLPLEHICGFCEDYDKVMFFLFCFLFFYAFLSRDDNNPRKAN